MRKCFSGIFKLAYAHRGSRRRFLFLKLFEFPVEKISRILDISSNKYPRKEEKMKKRYVGQKPALDFDSAGGV